jgi:CheY-like chemotaxis protein
MLPVGYHALRILIVDDIAHARMLLRGVLIHLGIRHITECGSVEEAFAALCHGQQDLVITDWDMPGGNGLALIRAIRTHARSPDPTLPVILLTAHGSHAQVRQGRDSGATDFLVKPFTPANIAARITDVVSHQRDNVITPTYRGPDRRRAQRPVGHERRSAIPPHNVVLLPADGLLQARVSGDTAAIARAKQSREAAAARFHAGVSGAGVSGARVSGAGVSGDGALTGSGADPASVLGALIVQAIEQPGGWHESLAQMQQPLARLLQARQRDMAPPLMRVAQVFQGFVANPERASRAPDLTRLLLMTMRAMLLIGQSSDAESIAHELAGEVEALLKAGTSPQPIMAQR